MFDVGAEHRQRVPRGVLQAREAFVGRELVAAALQHREESRGQHARPSASAIMSSTQAEAALRAAHSRASPPPALRQHLQRDAFRGAGLADRAAKRSEIT